MVGKNCRIARDISIKKSAFLRVLFWFVVRLFYLKPATFYSRVGNMRVTGEESTIVLHTLQ